MSSDDLNGISDIDLHCKLLEYGFPNLPVTETTRKILLKKLENFMIKNKSVEHKSFARHIDNFKDEVNYQNSLKSTSSSALEENVVANKSTNSMSTQNKKFKIPLYSKPHEKFNLNSETKQKIYSPLCVKSKNVSEKINPNLNVLYEIPKYKHRNSGIVNRLLSFREITNCNLYKKLCSSTNFDTGQKRDDSRIKLFSCLKMQYGLQQTIIPYILISILLLFFMILGFIYVFATPVLPSLIEEKNANFNVCTDDNYSRKTEEYFTCIHNNMMVETIGAIRKLYMILLQKIKRHYCINQTQSISINGAEFMSQIFTNEMKYIHSIIYMIKNNPEWNIDIIDSNGLPKTINDYDMSLSTEIYFKLRSYKIPLLCVLYDKIQRFFVLIGTGTLIGFLLLLYFVISRYLQSKRNKRIVAVKVFTDEIVSYLISANDSTQNNEVLINHLRNKLLPAKKQSQFMWSFNEAIRLLKLNDSRIQFGLTLLKGEEVEVMKWVGSTTSKAQYNNSIKKWQSPAFNNINKITNPPTPCLKIRHMFDTSENSYPNLNKVIEEAILYKVGPHCNVCDIQIDRETCCVYIRCASNADAGIVHNEINGWWFDMRLVSIKFLRLQRYLNRFPEPSKRFMSISQTTSLI